MSSPLNIVIVKTNGELKSLCVKDFKVDELYKKCGFKKEDDFKKQTQWKVFCEKKHFIIEVYAKKTGKANFENKYDFPPPIDTTLFFGSCAIVAKSSSVKNGEKFYTDLSLELWNKIYEKLFGGFEDLSATTKEDEEEEDELDKIPKEKKTKDGYLKDGFVVDSSDEGDSQENDYETDDEESSDTENSNSETSESGDNDDLSINDVGSELSEEEYDYEFDKKKKK
jgi:hypothetical protein